GALSFTNQEPVNTKLWPVAWKAVLVNLLNPKLSIFFLAFLPLFIDPSASSPAWQFLTLSAVFMLMTLGIFILYGLFAHAVSGYLVQTSFSRVWLQRGFAVIFAGLGAKLLFSVS
ncbi:MAG TPA: LysE family transporter, partial [SAR324 cluster bacterium]|nr:LysE family transporter [SAR324 cluster bacterium]